MITVLLADDQGLVRAGFRELLDEISMLMVYEVTRDFPTEEVEIETPITTMKAKMLAGKPIGIIPILRAGLGMVDGIMELIPYIGPIIAGIPAVLLALSGGWSRALWTLAVLVGVQQLEGGFLSPRMLSGATKLSPLTVLLSISAGGVLGGTWGMLLALPVVVSLRGAVRAWRAEKCQS